MTKELIAIPFKPASYGQGPDGLTRGKEYWTAKTSVYQTELSCSPTEIEFLEGNKYRFSTDHCKYTINPIFDHNGPRTMKYLWSNSNFFKNHYPTELGCKDTHFLAIWAKSRNDNNRSDELDINALLCKPSYHYQTHEVTVEGTDGSILDSVPVGEPTNFTREDKIIDILTFEGIVDGVATDYDVNAKYFSFQAPDSSRFEDWGLDLPSKSISYVIGLSPGKKFDDFRDPVTFRNGLERMHKLLFNNALETLLVANSDGGEVVGNRVDRSIGIVVVPLIAHILAGFLGLVVVCLGGVILISYNRQNNLAGDPDTLGTKMALVAHSETLLRDFNGADECPAPHLCMEPRKYQLGTWVGDSGCRLDVLGGRDDPLVQNQHASCSVPHNGKLVGPAELSIWTGIAATLVNIALLTLLIVLYKSALRWNGALHQLTLDYTTLLTCS